MHQTVQQPLPSDFGFPPQRKSVQSFITGDVAEHRFYGPHPLTVLYCALPASAVTAT